MADEDVQMVEMDVRLIDWRGVAAGRIMHQAPGWEVGKRKENWVVVRWRK